VNVQPARPEQRTDAVAGSTAGAESLLIRPISPDDKQAMTEAFEHLSEESRYRRFLSPHAGLTNAELRYFTEVDHHDHEALVAVDPATDGGVGVARYVRSRDDPSVAELAVAVVDEWQGQGVGSRLTAALAERARKESITSFSALLLADNQLMLSVLDDLGEVRVVHAELGTVEVIVDLTETGLGRLTRLLRAVARGEIIPFRPKLGPTPGRKDPEGSGRSASA
jgi:GNAT superfamily N-acetyltransferase